MFSCPNRKTLCFLMIYELCSVVSAGPSAGGISVSTSTWLYIGLGLVGTLLVAGIAIGAAIRLDRLCCARRGSSDTSSELEDSGAGPKPPHPPVVAVNAGSHHRHQPADIKAAFSVLPPLEEAADPDLILLTNGKTLVTIVILIFITFTHYIEFKYKYLNFFF